MTQGERVKEVRKSLNLTMEQFGNKLGVTKVAISNIEKEKRNLTEQMSRAICREFNVSEEWLKTGEGEMYQQLSEDEEIAGIVSDLLEEGKDNAFYGIILEIAKTYNELSPTSQKVLTEAAEKLADNLAKKKRD
jgi:transcriptional regulator with XRE-family HTH domain